jgi:hypothetical protein
MARRPKDDELVAGTFAMVPFTDEQLAKAVAKARAMGLVHIAIVGERGNALCGVVNVNCASVNHLTEVIDWARARLPAWKHLLPSSRAEAEES